MSGITHEPVKQALICLRVLSADEEARRLAFVRERAILDAETIKVFNHGNHSRDFTYINDVVEGVICVLDRPAPPNPDWSSGNPDSGSSTASWRVYNRGNNCLANLMDYIGAMEQARGKAANKELLPGQPGDLPDTWAKVDDIDQQFDYQPQMRVAKGVANCAAWLMRDQLGSISAAAAYSAHPS